MRQQSDDYIFVRFACKVNTDNTLPDKSAALIEAGIRLTKRSRPRLLAVLENANQQLLVRPPQNYRGA
jgi:hypothetical protein